MYFRKLFWWLVITVLWCDANFADPTDDKHRETISLSIERNDVIIQLTLRR